jgi:predicted 2-oxoglutarate/Fe(II)-dependent dioxygenase YbiX
MIVTIKNVLAPTEVAAMLERLNAAALVDGRVTAGRQSALAKHTTGSFPKALARRANLAPSSCRP